MDELFMKNFHRAAVLVSDHPDAILLYALALLNDRQSPRVPLQRFEEAVTKFPDHPNTVVAHHALAWLQFRARNVNQGLDHLARAVSRSPGPNHRYSQHLFAFAGRLTAFDRFALADEKPADRKRSDRVLQAVREQGESAQNLFRESWNEVQEEVKRRRLEMEGAESENERKGMEIQLTNINMYASFDPSSAIDYLEESLGSQP